MINTTKNDETKIFRAIQELKHLINRSDGNDKGTDRQQIAEQSKFVDRKYFGGRKKMEEDLDFFFNNNASQPKKGSTKLKKSNHTTRREQNPEIF